MIIIGNSNVDCFNRLDLESGPGGTPVSVVWVGALRVHHLLSSNSIGEKLMSCIRQTSDWVFLSLGTHDIYQVYSEANSGQLQQSIASMLQRYTTAFSSLPRTARIGWLVFPQPYNGVEALNLSFESRVLIAHKMNEAIAGICRSLRIAVVNPLESLCDRSGLVLKEYLQKDGLHLNAEGARFYLEKIKELTGSVFVPKTKRRTFEPADENESFCSLLINNLGLRQEGRPDAAVLTDHLIAFLNARIAGRGLDVRIEPAASLSGSGLIDSLDLVDLYSEASKFLGMEINFDVNLRELDSVANIAAFVLNACTAAPGDHSEPTEADFIISLREDFTDAASRESILAAEGRIGAMSAWLCGKLEEHYMLATEQAKGRYGTPLLWLALAHAGCQRWSQAITYLARSCDPRCLFPISGSKAVYYLQTWSAQRACPSWRGSINKEFRLRSHYST